MHGWNVVVTVRNAHFQRAIQLLRPFGRVEKTSFYDVLVLSVVDPRAFLRELHDRLPDAPEIRTVFGHVAPSDDAFNFQSPAEFAEKCAEVARTYVPQLARLRFHVRMHRRGFKGRLHATDEERFLDGFLLQGLAAADTPGEITFADPDAIVAIETVGGRAGMALWTRADLQAYPLLALD